MKKIFVFGLILLLAVGAHAAPTTTVSIPNPAVANTVIQSSSYNSNNNEIQTKYNAHSHTDITQLGTVTTGTWAATPPTTQYGGTGLDLSAATQGTLLYFSGTGVLSKLVANKDTYVLQTHGDSADPTWATASVAAINISGTMGASQVSSLLGAWTTGLSNNTVYQASTDGFVVAYNEDSQVTTDGYTDSSNPPTTKRINQHGNVNPCVTMPVRKGDYWKILMSAGGTPVIQWIPLGS